MQNPIDVPDDSVVVLLGPSRPRAALGALAALADRVPARACPWDAQRPQESLERLHEALGGRKAVRVVMAQTSARARRTVASAAKRRGFSCIVVRLPGSDAVGADEGHDAVHDLTGTDAAFRAVPSPCDLTALSGPFDFVGDVHGCADELSDLLRDLGHLGPDDAPRAHPEGRVAVFLGDLTDRGPKNLATLRLVRSMEGVGARRVLGNHDHKLARWLCGAAGMTIAPGLAGTIAELEALPAAEREEMGRWLGSAEPHIMLDGGRLAAAHAGVDERNQGRRTPRARSFALYGDTTGETDEEGAPVALDWALDYAGEATVVHGHVVHDAPRVVGNVVAIDTGCVFGGSLTAYRWPERTFASVPARRAYADRRIDRPAAV